MAVKPSDFKSDVYTNSTTLAFYSCQNAEATPNALGQIQSM